MERTLHNDENVRGWKKGKNLQMVSDESITDHLCQKSKNTPYSEARINPDHEGMP